MAGQSVSPSPTLPSKLPCFCSRLLHTPTRTPEKHLIPSMSKEQLIILSPVYTHLSTPCPNEWYLSSFIPVQFSNSHCPPPGIKLCLFQIRNASCLFPPLHVYKFCASSDPKPLLPSSLVFLRVVSSLPTGPPPLSFDMTNLMTVHTPTPGSSELAPVSG